MVLGHHLVWNFRSFTCWDQGADDIKIGLVTPLSAPGDYEAGKINVQTVELAVEQLNQKGVSSKKGCPGQGG